MTGVMTAESEEDLFSPAGKSGIEIHDVVDGDLTFKFYDFNREIITSGAFQFFITGQIIFVRIRVLFFTIFDSFN